MKSSDEILMDKIMKVVNEHLDDPALNVEMLRFRSRVEPGACAPQS